MSHSPSAKNDAPDPRDCSGEPELNIRQIHRLAKRFGVSPAVFHRPMRQKEHGDNNLDRSSTRRPLPHHPRSLRPKLSKIIAIPRAT